MGSKKDDDKEMYPYWEKFGDPNKWEVTRWRAGSAVWGEERPTAVTKEKLLELSENDEDWVNDVLDGEDVLMTRDLIAQFDTWELGVMFKKQHQTLWGIENDLP